MLSAPTLAGSAVADDAHARFLDRRHFGSLDGLRAVAVLAVVWHHTVGHDASLPALFARGAHGVTLFFAISGFLIVTLLLREWQNTGRIDLRAFYIRRTLRIFPLYYAVLGLYVLLVALIERNSPAGREFLANLPAFLSYTSNWFVVLDGRVIFYFAWSLAAEEQFYLVWPTMQKLLKPVAALVTIAVVMVGVVWLNANPPALEGGKLPLWYRVLTSIQLAICLGVAMAHLFHWRRSHGWMGWLFGWRASSLAFLLIAVAVLSSPAPAGWAIHLSLALLVAACVYREDHLLAGLLRWRVLAHVGMVSYGMYLLHMLVKNVVVKALGTVGLGQAKYLVFVLTALGAVAVATLSFRYFESIFLRYKSRYARAG
jgi:peptidoglycan/LPS O-acetylase OafA/YrhL